MALRELTLDIGFRIDSHPLIAANQATDDFKAKVLGAEADTLKLGAALDDVGSGATAGLGSAATAAANFGATASRAGMQFGSSVGAAAESTSRLGAQVDATRGKFQRLREAGVQAASALKKAYAEHKQQLEAIGNTLEKNRALLAGMFAATGGALGFSIKTAADFEAEMSRVAAISRATEEELSILTDTARELGATTAFSATEAAQGMQYLAMAGYDVQEIVAAMPGLLDTAAAAQSDLGVTADIVSNILSGFGLQAHETARVADVLTATFTSSNTTLESLGNTMSYVAPVAASLGVELEDVAALAGRLGDVGIQGERAGTALRAIMTRLAAPTGEAAAIMSQLGIVTTDSSGRLLPMIDILRQIEERTRDMGDAQRTATLTTLVGVEAVSALSALLDIGADNIGAYANELRNSAGVSQEVASRQLDNLRGSLKLLQSAFQEAQISIGNAFIPVVRAGANILTSVVNVFNSLPGPIRTTIAVGLGFAAMLTGAALAASFILPQLSHMAALLRLAQTGFLAVGKVIPWMTAGIAKLGVTLNISFLPATAIVLGVAGAILILQDVLMFLRGEGDTLTGRIVAWGREWISGLAVPITIAFGRVSDFVGRMVAGIRGLGGVIADMPGRIAGWFISGFQAGLQWLLGLPQRTVETLGAWLTSIREWFASAFNIGDVLAAGIERAMEWIPSPLRGVAERIMSFLPQSPAEEGPLSRLDRVGPGLVQAVADSIAAADMSPMVAAMNRALGQVTMPGFGDGESAPTGTPATPWASPAVGGHVFNIRVEVDARGSRSDDAERIGETIADRIRQVIEEFVQADWYAVALEGVD